VTKRCLVTGGAGFIGSHLVDALVARGDAVTVLDDFSSGKRENLDSARRAGDVSVIEGSILDAAAVQRAVRGCSRIFHLAVQCVRLSLGTPIKNHDINATGTIVVLDAARRAGVERFVYCSSSEIYGNCGGERLSEQTLPEPVTVYGAAKLAGEYYTKAYHQTYGLSTTIVRPFNAYGPREQDRGELAEVVPRFVIRVLSGLPPVIFGSGENGRDFTYVTESAAGIMRAGDCDTLVGEAVNIAFGRMIRIRDVARAIATACGRPEIDPSFIEPRPGDVFELQADTTKARNLLNFEAKISFEEGLQRYLDWFRKQYPNPRLLLEERLQNWELPA
jgi:UDP-glucose 4-epimerase